MKMRNYLKKKNTERVDIEALAEELTASDLVQRNAARTKVCVFVATILLLLPVSFVVLAGNGLKKVSVAEKSMVQLTVAPAAATVKKDIITIPSGTVKSNPFLPYRDISGTSTVADVPSYTLVEPPEALNANSDAARVMDTIVSGILFDKFSPSAILNIEGNDYLVKKGDVVNNYKVLGITETSVTVALGANVYKAGIGEILTEGSLNYNDVSNLSNKFGGER